MFVCFHHALAEVWINVLNQEKGVDNIFRQQRLQIMQNIYKKKSSLHVETSHLTPITGLHLVVSLRWTVAAPRWEITGAVESSRFQAPPDGHRGLKWRRRGADGGAKCSRAASRQHDDRRVWETALKRKETHLKARPAEIYLTFARRWKCQRECWMSGRITGGHRLENLTPVIKLNWSRSVSASGGWSRKTLL